MILHPGVHLKQHTEIRTIVAARPQLQQGPEGPLCVIAARFSEMVVLELVLEWPGKT